MKKTMKSLAVVLLIAVVTVSGLSGCGKNGGQKESSTPAESTGSSSAAVEETKNDEENSSDKVDIFSYDEKMKVKIAVLTGFTQSDSWNEKRLEDKYNIDIELVVLPGWSDGQAKINLLMADDKERPDIIWWWGMDNDFVLWKDSGLLVDAAPYMEKYTNIRDYYNKMDEKTLFYASSDNSSVYRIPGDVSEPSCEVTWVRKDWLDNLGLKVPTTLDELCDVMRAFTFDDPDGNGIDDTYGLGGDGYDFRSFWPFIQAYGNSHYDRFVLGDNDTVSYGPANPSAKEWVGKVAELYKEGAITPNIITDTDRDQEMAKGGFGVTYSWITYANTEASATMMSFYADHPDAEWIPIDMVTGPGGNPQEEPATSEAWAYFGITDNCSDPERLFAIYDDMCGLDNYVERRYGIEGEHYNIVDGKYVPVIGFESQENEDQNIGLKLFDNLFNRKDEGNIINSPETTELFNKSANNSRDYANIIVEWKDPSKFTTWLEHGTDIGDLKNEYLWGVIAGTKSLDDWDSYIAKLNEAGLEDVLDEAQTLYKKQKEEMAEYFAK